MASLIYLSKYCLTNIWYINIKQNYNFTNNGHQIHLSGDVYWGTFLQMQPSTINKGPYTYTLKVLNGGEDNFIGIGLTKQGWDGSDRFKNGVGYSSNDGAIYDHDDVPIKVADKSKLGDILTIETSPVLTTVYINGSPLVSMTNNKDKKMVLPTIEIFSKSATVDVDVTYKDKGNIFQKR